MAIVWGVPNFRIFTVLTQTCGIIPKFWPVQVSLFIFGTYLGKCCHFIPTPGILVFIDDKNRNLSGKNNVETEKEQMRV